MHSCYFDGILFTYDKSQMKLNIINHRFGRQYLLLVMSFDGCTQVVPTITKNVA